MMIPRPGRLFHQVSLQEARLILQNYLTDPLTNSVPDPLTTPAADALNNRFLGALFTGFASLTVAGPEQISFWTGKNLKELTATRAGLVLVPAQKEKDLATLTGPQSYPGHNYNHSHEHEHEHNHNYSPNHEQNHEQNHNHERTQGQTRFLSVSAVWPAFLHLLQHVWDTQAEQKARNEHRHRSVGENCQIADKCVISDFCVVGDNCTLHPGVVLYPGVEIGAGTVIHANSVIGQRGFGFYPSQSGLVKIEHYGGVIIGESCELGAQTSIAAGMLEPTVLGNGCCLDSQVHIAHNCRLGDECFIAAQCALAGRVEFASQVQMGGGSKVDNGVFVGQGAKISAMSGVSRNVKPGEHVCGFPARPVAQWRREQARLRFRDKDKRK